MFLLVLFIALTVVGLFEALLLRLVSKRVTGPPVPWRTAVYWGSVVVLVSVFLSWISRHPALSDIGALSISVVGWSGLHVGLGGLFLTDQVRGPDGARYPWRWGAKVTGIAGAIWVSALIAAACVFWFVQGATS
jgi:hypothetical protein